MPHAKPSQAAIVNVLSAMLAAGITSDRVRVDSAGGFEVETAPSVKLAETSPPAQDSIVSSVQCGE